VQEGEHTGIRSRVPPIELEAPSHTIHHGILHTMPKLDVSVKQETIDASRAAASAAGMNLSNWADKALSEAAWRERFSRSAERERQLGITPEWLAQYKAGAEEQRATG
jgi:hypothetical protein